jgi:hypothetical protein
LPFILLLLRFRTLKLADDAVLSFNFRCIVKQCMDRSNLIALIEVLTDAKETFAIIMNFGYY